MEKTNSYTYFGIGSKGEIDHRGENIDKMMRNKVFDLIKTEYEVFYQIIDEGMSRKEFKSNQSSDDLAYILYSTLTSLSITQFFGYISNALSECNRYLSKRNIQ